MRDYKGLYSRGSQITKLIIIGYTYTFHPPLILFIPITITHNAPFYLMHAYDYYLKECVYEFPWLQC